MNALIISVTAGRGHHAAAEAVAEALDARGIACHTVDLFKYINKFLYDTVDKGYAFSTKYIPRPYGQIYTALEKRSSLRRAGLDNIITELMANKFLNYLHGFHPDVVVCSHIFGGLIMDELKRRGEVSMPVVGILTDYCYHPFWNDAPYIEHIVIANDLMCYKAEQKGIDPAKLLPIGIPVHMKFETSVPKEEARRTLGLDPDRFTILLMSGSMGYGNLVKSVSLLDDMDEDFQVLCVCGSNEKAFEALAARSYRRDIRVHGFVTNGDLMMDAADCVITKPGGLTTSEAIVKRLPMILTTPIPGQEEQNRDFLTNCGVALHCTDSYTVADAVHYLYHNPRRTELMRRAIDAIRHPGAAAEVAGFIARLGPAERTSS